MGILRFVKLIQDWSLLKNGEKVAKRRRKLRRPSIDICKYFFKL